MSAGALEARTRELAGQLYRSMREYRPARRERRQDWLMGQLAREPALKARLLRFIDVLAALDNAGSERHIKELFQDYFSAPFPGCSPLLRLILFFGRQPAAPAGTVSGFSRKAMHALTGRFIAGSEFGDIQKILAYLDTQGRYSTIDLLGEDVLSEREAGQYKTRYLQLIDSLAGRYEPSRRYAVQLSLKLSSLTHNFNPADVEGTLERVRAPLEEIARSCASNGIGLNVDAELFEHREIAWQIFSTVFGPESLFSAWDGAGITVQSYFKDSGEYLQTVLDFARQRQAPLQIRLAKGAYWDQEVILARQNNWPPPVFDQKKDTDETFNSMMAKLLEENRHISLAVAGHNIVDHARAEALREALGLPDGAVEHQVLFRTSEGVSQALQKMGWRVRDYVPSGELVPGMAYLIRRVLENTSPEGFLMRSRSGESVEELLQPASGPQTSGQAADAGFHNHPPKRLFLASERTPFESALTEARNQWGQEYPIELGGSSLKTKEIKASLSPSHPDLATPVGYVSMAGAHETQQAIEIARNGFARWSAKSAPERAEILLKAAAALVGERDSLTAWIVHEGGRTWAEALADVDEAADHFAYNGHRLLDVRERVEKGFQPRGVVAVISPWNFPAALPAGMMSGALAAGNSVILKSAEQTPVIAAHLVRILHSAGVPEDALLHLPGLGETAGESLVTSGDVDMVAFTGSKTVGLSINRKASAARPASGLKKVVVEMGGKNPIIVFPDADLDEAVKGILLSAFEHANQKCSACSRVFVHRSIFKRLSERLIYVAASLPVGPADHPGTLVNPLIEPEARERVLAYAEKARREGKVLLDRLDTGSPNPLQLGPMVVECDLSRLPNLAIAREEIFGPILMLVPFEDESAMLAEVNGTAYALTAGVFSRSPTTISRMLRSVRAGNIYVNRKTTGARVGIEPFGGFQLSGTGPKAGGSDYLFAFLTRKDNARRDSQNTTADLPALPGAATVEPWLADAAERRKILTRAANLLEKELQTVAQASLPVLVAKQVVATASSVLEAAEEVIQPEDTIAIPGQKNYTDWQTPRGVGFIATDDSAPLERFAGMVFGPLLAGNGLALAPSPRLQPIGGILVNALHRAGVPKNVLALAPAGGPEVAEKLAEDMFHFAVTDMGLDATLRVYERLGVTREAEGQNWVKALVSMQEGHRPGEPGFVRQFALPKTISIRTLRHSAELEIPLK